MKPRDDQSLGDAGHLARSEVRRRSLAGVFYMMSSSFVNLIVGFLGTLFLARMLTPRDFGVVAIGATIVTLGGVVADGGLGSGMIRREEPPRRSELRALNGIQLAIALGLSLPVAVIALGFGETGAVTALMVMSLPIVILQTPGRLVLARTMRFERQAAIETGSLVASQAFAVGAVALGAGVWGLAAGSLVRAATGVLLTAVLSIGLLMPVARGWREMGDLMRFGVRFQASWLAVVARDQGVNASIALVSGVQTLGLWSLAVRLLQVPNFIYTSLYSVAFPAMSNLVARGEDVAAIVTRTVRRAAVSGALLFPPLAAASPKLVPALFGEAWADVADVIPFVALSTLMLGSISVAVTGYLNARGKPGIVLRGSIAFGVIWIPLTVALLPTLGVAAVGVANLCGAMVEALILERAMRRLAGVSAVRPLLRPLSVAVAAGVVGWIVCYRAPSGLGVAIAAALLTLGLVLVGLACVCRRDLVDTAGVAVSTVRSALRGTTDRAPTSDDPGGSSGESAETHASTGGPTGSET